MRQLKSYHAREKQRRYSRWLRRFGWATLVLSLTMFATGPERHAWLLLIVAGLCEVIAYDMWQSAGLVR